ncbi:hypothetical protein HMEPL2_38350 [Vreelandella aquamarina]|uniref:Uncharacterized protein n=1 Tax=Vreelandella aquamarina TaxID=77097 RepID=A0A6F8XI47_9GAMM|nr:hypothetical protein HMEPL2_38350 [Halomonas meridiana]
MLNPNQKINGGCHNGFNRVVVPDALVVDISFLTEFIDKLIDMAVFQISEIHLSRVAKSN